MSWYNFDHLGFFGKCSDRILCFHDFYYDLNNYTACLLCCIYKINIQKYITFVTLIWMIEYEFWQLFEGLNLLLGSPHTRCFGIREVIYTQVQVHIWNLSKFWMHIFFFQNKKWCAKLERSKTNIVVNFIFLLIAPSSSSSSSSLVIAMSSRSRNDIVTTVYVGGLTENIGNDQLQDEFDRFGPVKTVWVARNPSSRGYAFVDYYNKDHALEAVREMDGRFCFGSQIKLNFPNASLTRTTNLHNTKQA